MNHFNPTCPAELTLEFIEGRWKVIILWHLAQGVKRSFQLSQAITGISRRVLTQQLRQMERDGLVNREVFAQVPPRIMDLMWNRAFSHYYGEDANRIYEDRVKVCLPQRLDNLSLSQRVL